MNVNRLFCFYILFFSSIQLLAKTVSFERSVSSSTISLRGKEFTSVKKSENGVKTEEYMVNRVPVEKDQFYQELHKTKVDEMHEAQQESEKKQDEKDAMRDEVSNALLKKIITQSVQDLAQDLTVLANVTLQPYLVFEPKGIRSVSELDQMQSWLKNLQKNMKSFLAQSDSGALRNMADELETKLEMVQACLKKSIKNATAQSDDTAALKELLALIEG